MKHVREELIPIFNALRKNENLNHHISLPIRLNKL